MNISLPKHSKYIFRIHVTLNFFAKALKKSTHCLVIMAHYTLAVPIEKKKTKENAINVI
jgi:hypothetical protein